MKYLKKIALVIGLFVVHACGGSETTAPKAEEHAHEEENSVELTPEQFKTAGIQLGTVEMKKLSGTIKVNGMLDVPPQNLVSISTPFGGYLKSTEMLQGMKVRKGQKIAVLEHPDFIQLQQDYLDYKSQLDYLKLEYERQEELAADNVNAKKTVQKARSDYESMRARVNGQRARLEMMHISIPQLEKGKIRSTIELYSPINGYITAVNTNIGMFAGPTDVLFRIADTEHLHAELTVFEKDVPKLKIGQKVRFTLANESTERTATVYLIGREISSERTVNIHCHLDKEDGQLLPGMYLKALVESGGNDVAALPSGAIVEFQGDQYIFVAEAAHGTEKNRHFEMLKVETGVSQLGYTEVRLQNSDWKSLEVVTSGAYDLLSQMKNTESAGHAH